MTACIEQVCMWSLRFTFVLRLRKQKSWSHREADLEVGYRVRGVLCRIGHGGFSARSTIFPSSWSSYICSIFPVQGMGIVETTIPDGRTKTGKGMGQ